PIHPPTAVSAPGYRKNTAAKSQIAGLFAISRHEADDSADFSATGKGRLRMANASNTRNSATEPRKNGSNLCAAVQATMSEHNTAPTPQKKFSRLTALALALAVELASELASELTPEIGIDRAPISATSRLSVGIINPSPSP